MTPTTARLALLGAVLGLGHVRFEVAAIVGAMFSAAYVIHRRTPR